jgi:hypothetical protein
MAKGTLPPGLAKYEFKKKGSKIAAKKKSKAAKVSPQITPQMPWMVPPMAKINTIGVPKRTKKGKKTK